MLSQIQYPIILASASPRRAELLRQIGVGFTVHAANIDESLNPDFTMESNITLLAVKKAEAVALQIQKQAIIIGADTLVYAKGKVLGQPKDAKDAAAMISLLSGSQHEVITGVCILFNEYNVKNRAGPAIKRVFFEKTKVFFNKLDDSEIVEYVKSGEPMDKAGAYAIQGRGAMFIKKIEGDYYNVVGLPLSALYHNLCKFIKILPIHTG